MKTELLAALAGIQSSLDATSVLVNALPDDPAVPAPVPDAPTGLAVVNTVPQGGALTIMLAWNPIPPSPFTTILEVKGADTNPAGPQEWTDCNYNRNNNPGPNGELFSYFLVNPAGQVIIFRLTARNADGVDASVELPVNADDYPQT